MTLDVVTGAFSYSGAAIAARLRASGVRVRTLTGHPGRAPDDTSIEVRPLDFNDRDALVSALRGARTLYNTYWIRFARGELDHAAAITNSRTLFHCAQEAGVERVVHISITHPSSTSPYPYFRGKAAVERALLETGLPHTVLRPAILFGGRGVLINNIAWLLRHSPVFAIGGLGDYRVRGIHVDDLAALSAVAGVDTADYRVIDAVGPERPTFFELVREVRRAVRSTTVLVPLPGPMLVGVSSLLGMMLRDTLLTGEEYHAMTDGLADTDGPATGKTRLSEWLAAHGDELGRTYAHEIDLHFR